MTNNDFLEKAWSPDRTKLWVVALTLQVIAMVRGKDEFFRAGRWVLYAGSIGAPAAVASGLWAANQTGHDSPFSTRRFPPWFGFWISPPRFFLFTHKFCRGTGHILPRIGADSR